MKKIFLAATISVVSIAAFAIEEASYAVNYASKVLPYYQAAKIETMAGVNKVPVRFQIYKEDTKNCLMLFPGRQESLDKYAEVVYDLNHNKNFPVMTVMVVDHRGQGLSGRMTSNPQVGYVDQFEDYVSDVDMLFKTRLQELGCNNYYLLAHSMGGAIGLGLLLKEQVHFKAAVFSAPMWMINTKPYPNFIASIIGGVTTTMGQGEKYAIGQSDYLEVPLKQTTTTHSASRYEMAQNIYRKTPATIVGGVSNRWVYESLNYTKMLRQKAKDLELPIVIMQAGEDTFVKLKGHDIVCKKAKFCQKYLFPTSFHEILMEEDKIRDEAMLITSRMFADHQ
ncbi:MAG: alpha/beta fold hydrolase [Bacteriovoracaceae bacterium]